MRLLYSLGLFLYQFGIRLAAAWNPKARLWVNGRQDWQEHLAKKLTIVNQPIVWIHCASLGEFEQGRPVIEGLRSAYPKHSILLSFFSPSGLEAAKKFGGADIITYLPLDGPASSRRFLDLVKPSLAIFVKYEYWHYYLSGLKKRSIPALMISASYRRNQPFFRFYGAFWREMLNAFYQIFVQDKGSLELLQSIRPQAGIAIAGDTRFDRVTRIAAEIKPLPAIEMFCGSDPVVVVGSTWPEDEDEICHFANVQSGVRWILAPHEVHPDRLTEIQKHFRHRVLYSEFAGYTEKEQGQKRLEANVLIIDNIGMLANLYRYGHVCYVGGGFGGDGVHNVLEAAVYGKPVLYGPVFEKYLEAVELLESGGAATVDSAVAFEKQLSLLLSDEALRSAMGRSSYEYVRSKTGATDRILRFIQEKRLLTN